MGLTLVEEHETLIITDSPDASVVVVNEPDSTLVLEESSETVVIEVLAGSQGEPGVQNLFVGTTPPSNPQEGWVWIDTSA